MGSDTRFEMAMLTCMASVFIAARFRVCVAAAVLGDARDEPTGWLAEYAVVVRVRGRCSEADEYS